MAGVMLYLSPNPSLKKMAASTVPRNILSRSDTPDILTVMLERHMQGLWLTVSVETCIPAVSPESANSENKAVLAPLDQPTHQLNITN